MGFCFCPFLQKLFFSLSVLRALGGCFKKIPKYLCVEPLPFPPGTEKVSRLLLPSLAYAMPHLAGSSLKGKCFSDVSRTQRAKLLPFGRVLGCPTTAFHAGRDRRTELKSQGPYGCIKMMYSLAIIATLFHLSGVRHQPLKLELAHAILRRAWSLIF